MPIEKFGLYPVLKLLKLEPKNLPAKIADAYESRRVNMNLLLEKLEITLPAWTPNQPVGNLAEEAMRLWEYVGYTETELFGRDMKMRILRNVVQRIATQLTFVIVDWAPGCIAAAAVLFTAALTQIPVNSEQLFKIWASTSKKVSQTLTLLKIILKNRACLIDNTWITQGYADISGIDFVYTEFYQADFGGISNLDEEKDCDLLFEAVIELECCGKTLRLPEFALTTARSIINHLWRHPLLDAETKGSAILRCKWIGISLSYAAKLHLFVLEPGDIIKLLVLPNMASYVLSQALESVEESINAFLGSGDRNKFTIPDEAQGLDVQQNAIWCWIELGRGADIPAKLIVSIVGNVEKRSMVNGIEGLNRETAPVAVVMLVAAFYGEPVDASEYHAILNLQELPVESKAPFQAFDALAAHRHCLIEEEWLIRGGGDMDGLPGSYEDLRANWS
ncbi:hypothetical protein BJ508DRAFT_334182 [Ascobolus immersus RN42]|uniref:Uncharacterized protein n=1 Tax=Ascobolus immersus RN42 TaxID=1160509 RepID=A0A3N4HLC4_ASCIM|nr:hypothetical protein BJ508DRAFT_334182 [Ascobolus immersus RN42]